MAKTPDLSGLSSYARNNITGLISTMLNGLDIAQDVQVIQNVKDEYVLPKLTAEPGSRPFSSTEEFGTDGKLTYGDRKLSVKPGKYELQIDVDLYRTTYLNKNLSAGSGASKKEIPFAQYTWGEVVKRVAQELNDEHAYFGFDGTVTAEWVGGTTTYAIGDRVTYTQNGVKHWFEAVAATNGGESPDTHPAKWRKVTARAIGDALRAIITSEISGGALSPVATGAITDGATAVTAFRKLFRSMPTAYKSRQSVIHSSYTDYEYLLDGIEDKISKYTRDDVSGFAYLPGTDRRCIVKPASWLVGSRRLICEPSESNGRGMNLHMGTDLLRDTNDISVKDSDLWVLKAGIKFLVGYQIADLNALRVGDQA